MSETRILRKNNEKWFELQITRNILSLWLTPPSHTEWEKSKTRLKIFRKKYGKALWAIYRVAYRVDPEGHPLARNDDSFPNNFQIPMTSRYEDSSSWFSEEDKMLFQKYRKSKHRLPHTDAVVLRIGFGFGDVDIGLGGVGYRSKKGFVSKEEVPVFRIQTAELGSTKLYEVLSERFWNKHIFLDSQSTNKKAWERSLFEVDEFIAFSFLGEFWKYCITRQGSAPFPQGKYAEALSQMTWLVKHLLEANVYHLNEDQFKEYKELFAIDICPVKGDHIKPSNLPQKWRALYNFNRKSFQQQLLSEGAVILNQVNALLNDSPSDAITDFLQAFFDSIASELFTRKLLASCQYCDSFFSLFGNPTKRFCSLQSERRNCGKRARNRKFYAAHPELRSSQKRRMKTLRDYYKSFGIKK